jgi:hypothetical protein
MGHENCRGFEKGLSVMCAFKIGIKIVDPVAFIHWDMRAQKIYNLFEKDKVHKVSDDYYVISCTLDDGLKTMLGLHFTNGLLYWLELFRGKDYGGPEILKTSFEDYQKHLIQIFGEPSITQEGEFGFKNYKWEFEKIRVHHSVYERFCLNESVGIMIK